MEDDYNNVEIVTLDDSTSDDEEAEEDVDLDTCNWLMTSDITVEEVTPTYPPPESPFEPREVPDKLDFFWYGLDPNKDQLLVNARKRPPNGNWMCGFCYRWTNTKEELSNHMKAAHISLARFHVCKICHSRYVTKFLLERHEDTHKYRPTLPYSRYNSEDVTKAASLKNHYLKGIRPARPTKEAVQEAGAIFQRVANTKHNCLSCFKIFDHADQLHEHYMNTHASIYCRLCSADDPPTLFPQFVDLKTHLILTHGLKNLDYYIDDYFKIWEWIKGEQRFNDPEVVRSYLQFFHPYAAKEIPLSSLETIVISEPYQFPGLNESIAEDGGENYIISEVGSCASSPKSTTIYSSAPSLRSNKSLHSLTQEVISDDTSLEALVYAAVSKPTKTQPIDIPKKKCHVCKKLVTYVAYQKHLNSHAELKYKCDQMGCNKRFLKNSSLQLHSRAHSMERQFICHLCPRGYNYSSLLRRHLRTHTGELPYRCDTCGQRFYELVSLNYHKKKVHTGERPHKCSFCHKGFILANDLKKHLQAHEKNSLTAVSTSLTSN